MLTKIVSWYITTRFQTYQLVMMWLHTGFKRPLANTLVYVGLLQRTLGNKKAGLNLILKGRRVGNVGRATSIIRNIVCSSDVNKSVFVELLPKSAGGSVEEIASRILILKLPMVNDGEVIEKGAIIIKFSETFAPVYLSLDVNLLSEYFRVILEPSSSGYSSEEILVWTKLDPEKVVVLSPDEGDFCFLTDIHSNLIPVSLGAADWVNPKNFYKIDNTKKPYDVIYIANFNPVKRVDRYIRAIVRINREKKHDFHAALVCAGYGTSRRAILAMLERVRGKSNIAFFNAMPQSELNKLLNQSKVNVLLSLKEGANKGLAEGLFAGTPALLLAENVGVNRLNINDLTGRIIPDEELEEALMWFSQHYHEFAADEWAMKYVSPLASTKKLSQVLKQIELAEGRQWSVELMPKVNQPELAYLNPDDQWLLSKRVELLQGFSKAGTAESVEQCLNRLLDSNV